MDFSTTIFKVRGELFISNTARLWWIIGNISVLWQDGWYKLPYHNIICRLGRGGSQTSEHICLVLYYIVIYSHVLYLRPAILQMVCCICNYSFENSVAKVLKVLFLEATPNQYRISYTRVCEHARKSISTQIVIFQIFQLMWRYGTML